jgi:nicotinamidase-related amidase
VGLVVVDEVNGFCTVGAGNLAPRQPDEQVAQMVKETVQMAKAFSSRGWPILALLDTHEEHKPEPPYPPHCIRGTGEENLIPGL